MILIKPFLILYLLNDLIVYSFYILYNRLVIIKNLSIHIDLSIKFYMIFFNSYNFRSFLEAQRYL